MSKPVFSDDKVHIMPAKCSTCIFRPGNLMMLKKSTVKEMVDACRAKEGGNIPCHQTIHGQRDQQAICRGFWDSYAEEDPLLRLAQAMGVVEEVAP